jgi:hypothetical protein
LHRYREAGRAVQGGGVRKRLRVVAVDRAGEMLAVLVQVVEENPIDRLLAVQLEERPIDGSQPAGRHHLLDLGPQPFERAAGDGFAPEGGSEFVPLRRVVLEIDREFPNQAARRFAQHRLERRVEQAELLEVGEDREGDGRVPGVPLRLENGLPVGVDIDGRLLRLDDETRKTVRAEQVVRLGMPWRRRRSTNIGRAAAAGITSSVRQLCYLTPPIALPHPANCATSVRQKMPTPRAQLAGWLAGWKGKA